VSSLFEMQFTLSLFFLPLLFFDAIFLVSVLLIAYAKGEEQQPTITKHKPTPTPNHGPQPNENCDGASCAHRFVKHDDSNDTNGKKFEQTKCKFGAFCPTRIVNNDYDNSDHKSKHHHNDSSNSNDKKLQQINDLFRSKVDVPKVAAVTIGFNETFWNGTVPYCWYVVNLPPCYDTLNNVLKR
jgi:hypothetical protein